MREEVFKMLSEMKTHLEKFKELSLKSFEFAKDKEEEIKTLFKEDKEIIDLNNEIDELLDYIRLYVEKN